MHVFPSRADEMGREQQEQQHHVTTLKFNNFPSIETNLGIRFLGINSKVFDCMFGEFGNHTLISPFSPMIGFQGTPDTNHPVK